MNSRYIYHAASGRNYRLDDGRELTIGRAFDNHIIVDDLSVSRHHACVGMLNGKVYVKDLHSTNGTVINAERVWDDFRYELQEADEFQVGSVIFKILDENSVISRNFQNRKMPMDTVIMYAGC